MRVDTCPRLHRRHNANKSGETKLRDNFIEIEPNNPIT